MAGYLSPATFQTPNEWKARGALGGYLAGMNQEISNQIVGREFANDDLERQKKMAELEESQKTLDSKIALEAAKARLAGMQADRFNEKTDADIASSKASTKGQELKNADEERVQAANLWVEMSNELKSMGGQLNPMDSNHREWYNGWREKMQKFAPNMPAMLDTAGSQNVMMQGQKGQQFLAMKAQSALNPRDTQIKEAAAVANDARDTARAKEVATIQGKTSRDVAAANNERALEVQRLKQEAKDMAKKYEQAATRDVVRAKESGKIDETAIGSAEWLAEQRINDRMKVDPEFKLSMLEGGEISETKYRVMRDAVAEQILPGYSKAKTGQQSKTVTPKAAAKPDNVEASAKSAFGAYEPDKYEYGINPKTGKFARKPK